MTGLSDDASRLDRPAGIEYHGVAGASQECQTAVLRLLQFGPVVVRARIITSGNRHCLMLVNQVGDPIAVKSGFMSGYGGSGPWALSTCLQALDAVGVDIDEWLGDEALISRLDRSALSLADVEMILEGAPVRPGRWGDYVLEHHRGRAESGALWNEFPPVMPFAILDRRLIDLALMFWTDPDNALLRGYRRLEDVVRARTGLQEFSYKLLSDTFVGKNSVLTWPVAEESESLGRGQLFTGAFQAFRNPRGHHELKGAMLPEFLLLNQLFVLEAQAVPRESRRKIESDGDLSDPQ